MISVSLLFSHCLIAYYTSSVVTKASLCGSNRSESCCPSSVLVSCVTSSLLAPSSLSCTLCTIVPILFIVPVCTLRTKEVIQCSTQDVGSRRKRLARCHRWRTSTSVPQSARSGSVAILGARRGTRHLTVQRSCHRQQAVGEKVLS